MTCLRALWKATLIVVAVGVALMHTTGHACTDNVCHSETSSAAAVGEMHAAPAEDEDHHDHPMGTGMNPMQVCMAILTGLALAVSLWAIWRLTRMASDSQLVLRLRRVAWDMPVSLPPGGRLSYMELSVFRI
ncbi:hypothetical protein [Glycomyces algeriensis]|uniref:Uncharacterized protein n=1 Tax=Glycomyces algeriensis TaxID=256037 RepID=A0A9W6GEB4_9ACTN|nr:hypothetical protein [Glycomyces algeriensis]MDA1368617.1 hypothetical protein [Glycomyces algeriensis]MDR7352416.1 hypothetical protein [Glycomyces algeriensis]GLI45153.1 hypothetical protein GALLR39Z86_50030 [Glycomyces algeriensis]